MYRIKDSSWVGVQPLAGQLEGEVGQALMGVFFQVSGALSCWAAGSFAPAIFSQPNNWPK